MNPNEETSFLNYSSNLLTDIYTDGNERVIEINLPGFTKAEVNITYENGYLNLVAKKDESKTVTGREYLRKERYLGEQRRSYYIGLIKEELITAEAKDGVLTIKMTDHEQPTKPIKTIEIK